MKCTVKAMRSLSGRLLYCMMVFMAINSCLVGGDSMCFNFCHFYSFYPSVCFFCVEGWWDREGSVNNCLY